MMGFFAKSELKRTQTPTWTTLLLDYAIKVVHFGEWVWISTSGFAKITKSRFAVRGGEKIAYWCMPFLSYSLFCLSKFYVILSLFSLVSFSVLCIHFLSHSLPSIYGYYSYLY